MSTHLEERETEYGRICLTQFSGGVERGVMVQIDGPNVHRVSQSHWITLTPDDAAWLAMCLWRWAYTCEARRLSREQIP